MGSDKKVVMPMRRLITVKPSQKYPYVPLKIAIPAVKSAIGAAETAHEKTCTFQNRSKESRPRINVDKVTQASSNTMNSTL